MIDIATADNTALDAEVIKHDLSLGARAANHVHAFMGRFVAYPSPEAHDAHTLWTLHAHLMHHWDSTPRIAFLSPEPASGKSRALEVTALTVPNPVEAVNVSPAYLFRKIGSAEGLPTVCFDEIDTVFGPKAKENEELRGLLNAGHRRGAVAGRCVVRGKEIMTEELPAYCAVALAGLGWLPDTILSRSIVVRMRRRAPGEIVEQFRHRIHSVQAAPVFEAVAAWAGTITKIEYSDCPPEIQDRAADVWEPLITVADMIGGDWPKRARKAALELVKAGQDAEPSLGIRLLADIRTVFADAAQMPSKVLVAGLLELEESPWADLKGKALDERALARRLKQYSIKSRVMWFGPKQARGYEQSDFTDAWARYLPAESVTNVTTVTSAHSTGISNVTDIKARVTSVTSRQGKNVEKSTPVTSVTDVTQFCAYCGGNGELTVMASPGNPEPIHIHEGCVDAWMARP